MASKNPKNPGLGIDSTPARRAALIRMLGTLVAVKVDPKFAKLSR